MITENHILTLIAAVGKNNVLGGENRLLWQQKTDLAYFKSQTLNKPLIMGRKTFESLPRALPSRLNIVLSRQNIHYKNAICVNTPENALEIAKAYATTKSLDEIMIIGGGQIYALFLPLATRLLLTQIDASPQGDVFFPAINPLHWQLTHEKAQEKQQGDDHNMIFRTYERHKP